ncbi:MAG: hypothetical protein Q8N51_00235 [Gammaproteobacteria bacterium]|nr:hypothetical protein [Gammaproteobacteria bacterium]
MISGVTSRLHRAFTEYGVANTVLFGLQQFIQKFKPGAVIERLYIVIQPVPGTAASIGRRGAHIEIRPINSRDPALGAFTRIPAELADRFAQNAVCLGAFRAGELLGWLWFVPGVFRDFTHPVTFKLLPAKGTTWDFDVYVRPDARLSAAFVRLWEAAFQAMRNLGVSQTLSAISAYNPASLRAHHRLGTRPLGSILVVRLGRFQAVCTRRFKPYLQWSCRPHFRAELLLNVPKYN